MKYLLLALFCIFQKTVCSAQFTSYFSGDTSNVSTQASGGSCLMGGASEQDEAMRWFLRQANGGDVLVLRCTGSNGYNAYLFSQLGVAVNSVETLLLPNLNAAINPYTIRRINEAEAIWFAGGDQYNYVQYFKNAAVRTALNNAISRKTVFGGTSAGMAIMGQAYFMAQNGTITSAEALQNPFDSKLTLGYNDFLQVPFLQNAITDTHFDNPDRSGRLVSFMARLATDFGISQPLGIAANEYVAVCIDSNGLASVYGDYPNYQEYAYFVYPNPILSGTNPETCLANQPLTWYKNASPLAVFKAKATPNGTEKFLIPSRTIIADTNAIRQYWYVQNGVMTIANMPSVATNAVEIDNISVINAQNQLILQGLEPQKNYAIQVFDGVGRLVLSQNASQKTQVTLALNAALPPQILVVKITSNHKTSFFKIPINHD